MPKDQAYYTDLLLGYIDNRLSPQAVEELFGFISADPDAYGQVMNSAQIREALETKADNEDFGVSADISDRMRARLLAAVGKTEAPVFTMQPATDTESVRYIAKRGPFRYMTAASFIVLLGLTAYFLFFRNTRPVPQIIAVTKQTDISPGSNKAILTLANGSTIVLDSAQNGLLAQQNGTSIIKTDSGKLAYNNSNASNNSKEKPAEISYNTLTTPRGGQYQIILPDGTKVWLNAASSITYPTAFTGKERKVTVTGEVYVEVIHNTRQPFRVEVSGSEIEDIGTHFNINAYPEEKTINTTLLEGKIRVDKKLTLQPNQQARVSGSAIELVEHPDIEKTMAWREEKIVLTHGDVQKLFQDISRWYDVDVEYKGAIPEGQFSGTIRRTVPLSSLLNVLKAYGIETKLENKKIIVQ